MNHPFFSPVEKPEGLMKRLAHFFTRKTLVNMPTPIKENVKSRDLHQELRRRILSLSGVTERENAGIHEDAFFVGRTMFMHIHGHGHCDIRLAKSDQARVLAEGKARPHRWAPEKGYVTFVTRDEKDLAGAMELVHISHDHFAGEQQ